MITRVVCLAACALLLAGCTQAARETDADPQELPNTTLIAGEAAASPFDQPAKAYVLIFARTDCPISNRYAPEVRELTERFSPQGVTFALIYPDPPTSSEEIAAHRREFQYPCPGFPDPSHALVALAGATITPEAAVFDAGRQLVYCGRIDDRFAALGQERVAATTHDLADAIARVLTGEQSGEAVRTKAVGCYIGDLR